MIRAASQAGKEVSLGCKERGICCQFTLATNYRLKDYGIVTDTVILKKRCNIIS